MRSFNSLSFSLLFLSICKRSERIVNSFLRKMFDMFFMVVWCVCVFFSWVIFLFFLHVLCTFFSEAVISTIFCNAYKHVNMFWFFLALSQCTSQIIYTFKCVCKLLKEKLFRGSCYSLSLYLLDSLLSSLLVIIMYGKGQFPTSSIYCFY